MKNKKFKMLNDVGIEVNYTVLGITSNDKDDKFVVYTNFMPSDNEFGYRLLAGKLVSEEPFEVRKEGETYVVEGPYIEKLLRHSNFEDAESMQYFQIALRRKGIIEALENAGCGEGDPVRMYELEFDYTE